MNRVRQIRCAQLRFEQLELRRVMSGTSVKAAVAATWFSANIHNVPLRNLAQSDYQDGVLSRTDMIGLLRQVEKAGSLTSSEFSDLKNIVNDAGLFTNVGYVQQLAQDIVLGNPANVHYLGAALGNLKIGSTATQLEHLLDKWFLGSDHPLGTSDWGPTYSYHQAAGQLFVNGVTYTDINQGGLGDCYFLSSLAETALKNASAITSMFIVNGDGTYTVRFYRGSTPEYVTVDTMLPTDSQGYLVFDGMGRKANSASNELWVELAERAYVQMNECGWIRPASWGGGQNKYTGISGGDMAMAMSQITGLSSIGAVSTRGSSGFSAVVAAFSAGKEICFGSLDSPANSSLVVGDHAYAMVGFNATTKTITLFNPWGINNGEAPGLVTLTWSQIQANFADFERTA